jgi:hypothetical protein
MERMFTNLNVGLLLESSQNVTKHCKKINWSLIWFTKLINSKHPNLWYFLQIILFMLICGGLVYSFSIGI